jgi:hypothetical protein
MRLVLVQWRDTREVGDTWHDMEEVLKTSSSIIHSVGWITEETDVDLKISADYPLELDDKDVGRTTVIPHGCVESIKDLVLKE